MSENSYFVKVRGRTLGPFDSGRLRQMVQQGQVSRTNPVSTDGKTWQKAGDFSELFQVRPVATPASKSTAADPAAATVQISPQRAAERGGGSATATVQESSGTSAWYYGVGDSHEGPVTEGVIRELIQSGRLRSDEYVWREGMVDWQPVSRIKEFANLFPATTDFRATYGSQERASKQAANFTETKFILAGSAGWITFVCVLGYLFGGIGLFGSIALLVAALNVGSRVGIVQSLLGMFSPLALIGVTVYVNFYLITSNRFRITERIEDLNTSLRWLGRIWFVLSVFGFVMLLILITLVIMWIVAGASAGDLFA